MLAIQARQVQRLEKLAAANPSFRPALSIEINQYNKLLESVRRFHRVVDKQPFETTLPEVAMPEKDGDLVWKQKPVSMTEFVQSGEYLGMEGSIYPNILAQAKEWERDDIREGWLVAGKGSGKSCLASLVLARGAYLLLCMRDYRKTLRFPVGNIYMLNLSTSKDQAENVIFEHLLGMLQGSEWFKGKFRQTKREIDFGRGIKAVSGHSSSRAWVGYSLYRGVLDEADFLMDKKDRVVAQELYEVLLSQARTRFPGWYKIVVVTSLGGETSFASRELKEMRAHGTKREDLITV